MRKVSNQFTRAAPTLTGKRFHVARREPGARALVANDADGRRLAAEELWTLLAVTAYT